MRIVPDTSIWTEFFKKHDRYFSILRNHMENREVLAVESVFGELLQGAKNTRERDLIDSYWTHVPKARVDNLFVEAGKYSSIHKLVSKGAGLIDCAIILSARRYGAQIWSLDERLNRLLDSTEAYDPEKR